MKRIILFIIGIFLSSNGLSYMIIYLNLLVMNYSITDYLRYIFTKIECLSFFVGYILILLSIYVKRRNSN